MMEGRMSRLLRHIRLVAFRASLPPGQRHLHTSRAPAGTAYMDTQCCKPAENLTCIELTLFNDKMSPQIKFPPMQRHCCAVRLLDPPLHSGWDCAASVSTRPHWCLDDAKLLAETLLSSRKIDSK